CPDYCMAINEEEVLDWNPGRSSVSYPGVPIRSEFDTDVTLQLWDDDNKPHCGPIPDPHGTIGDDDDICELSPHDSSSLGWTTNEVGFANIRYDYGGCDGNGYFKLTYENNSVPFYGSVDELQIFAQPLDADAVRRLYLDVVTAFHLPLDEPPGATAFQDTSYAYVPSSCGGDACPTSGIPGRLNQGLLFDGQGDYLEAPLDVSETNYALSLWFKTSCADCGIFSVDEGALGAGGHDRHVYLNGGKVCARVFSDETVCTGGTNYADGQWHHVVHTFGGTEGGQKLYLDGVLGASGEKSASDFTWQDGINIGYSNDAVRGYFYGAIDDVWVFDMALSAARVAELYGSAPSLHLRFDEAYGATQFADNAADRFGTCTGSGCPLVGEAVRGQIGLAAQFDGVDDTVTVDNFGTFDTVSVSAWVYRTGATAVRETIVSYKQAVGKGFVLALEGQRPKFYVNVDGAWKSASPTEGEIPPNQWVHLAGTYDGQTLRLYRNGLPVASLDAPGAMTQGTGITSVGSQNTSKQHFFPGAIDQVRIYGRPLTERQIWDQYQYESAWVEDRQSRDITVDDDLPTAEVVMTEGSYLAKQATVVGVTAGDPTSDVDAVELGVQASAGTIAWAPAVRCSDTETQPEGAWCAPFAPVAEGV
ncbi:MAG: LamG domain-containing protein, partial [Anaerolineae bacterium]